MKKNGIFFLILVIFCAECTRELTKKEQEKEINNLINQYASGNWEKRRDVLIKISRFNTPAAEDVMITALQDSHTSVKLESIRIIGEKRYKKARPYLKEIAGTEANSNVRWYAIKSLSNYKDATAAPVFGRGLESSDWLIREASIIALLQISDPVIRHISIPYILKALDDSSESVKIAALINLDFKSDRILIKITELFNKTDTFVRINLTKAILTALNGYEISGELSDQLIKLLTHPNTEVRLLALAVLKKDSEIEKIRKKKKRKIISFFLFQHTPGSGCLPCRVYTGREQVPSEFRIA